MRNLQITSGRFLNEKADVDNENSSAVSALQRLSFMIILMSALVSIFFFAVEGVLFKPRTPPDEWWMSLTVGQLELWDLLFPIATIWMAWSVYSLKRVRRAYIFSAFTWGLLGLVWCAGSISIHPSPFFGVGILALFISIIHIGLIQVWSAEGVR